MLKYYIENGWGSALRPLEGYLTLAANALVILCAAISFVHLPVLMYVCALLVFVVTILLIAIPDSRWGDWTTRAAMAVSAALVPANPEVFGVLLYCFWWTTLWPIAILGWTRSLWALRAPLLTIAALSSPAGAAAFVIFAVAYVLRRETRDAISAAILFAGFVPQAILTLTSSRGEMVSNPNVKAIVQQVLLTGGLFESAWLAIGRWDLYFLSFLGLVLFAFLVVSSLVVAIRTQKQEAVLMTLTGFLFTVLSAIPVPLLASPYTAAGPRYYFLPFVAYGWILIYLWRADVTPIRQTCGALLVLSMFNLPATFSRAPDTRTARLSWRDELTKCASSMSPVVHIPINYVGAAEQLWAPLDLTPAQCRQLTK